MSREVDERVVAMYFDNKDFEKNAQSTIKTLDDLKKGLDLQESAKGLETLQKAGKELNFDRAATSASKLKSVLGGLGTALGSAFNVGTGPLQSLTNLFSTFSGYVQKFIGYDLASKLVGSMESAIRELTIAPVSAGWNEYELKMDSIKTIMSGTGESLDVVKEKLEELNHYADKTIYSFSDMTNNIGKFTNNGVALDDATSAIKGIANAAADAGQGAQQASMAMYNISQALGVGSMKLVDWKSLENANIATSKLKDTFLMFGGALGKLKKYTDKEGKIHYFAFDETTKSGKTASKKLSEKKVAGMTSKELEEYLKKNSLSEVTAENFRESLSSDWLDKDVLLRTLQAYSGDELDIDTIMSWGGFTEEQALEIIELGKEAAKAATEVRTFTKMWDALKEAAQSGWAQSIEYVFGDMEEGTNLWTRLNDVLGEVLNNSAESRNNILLSWRGMERQEDGTIKAIRGAMDGRQRLIDGVFQIIYAMRELGSVFGTAWGNVFGKMTGEKLYALTDQFTKMAFRVRNWLGIFDNGETRLSKIRKGLQGVFSIIKTGVNFIKIGFNLISRLVSPVADVMINLFESFGNFFDGMGDLSPDQVFAKIGDGIGILYNKITSLFSVGENGNSPISDFLSNLWTDLKKTVREWAEENGLGGTLDTLTTAWKSVESWTGWQTIANAFNAAKKGIEDAWNTVSNWSGWAAIGEFFTNIWAWFTKKRGSGKGKYQDRIDAITGDSDVYGPAGKTGFVSWLENVLANVKTAWAKVTGWNGWTAIGEFFSDIWSWFTKKTAGGNGKTSLQNRMDALTGDLEASAMPTAKTGFVAWRDGIKATLESAWNNIYNWDAWAKIGTFFSDIGAFIGEKAGIAIDWFAKPQTNGKTGFTEWLDEVWTEIKAVWFDIVDAGKPIWDQIAKFCSDLWGWVTGGHSSGESGPDENGLYTAQLPEVVKDSRRNSVAAFIHNTWEAIKNAWNEVTKTGGGIIDEIAQFITNIWGWITGKNGSVEGANIGEALPSTVNEAGVSLLTTVLDGISSFWGKLVEFAGQVTTNKQVEQIWSIVSKTIETLLTIVEGVVNLFHSAIAEGNIGSMAIIGILGGILLVFNYIRSNFVSKKLSSMATIAENTQSIGMQFLEVAGGIALMAAAIAALSAIDSGDMWRAVGALAIIGALVAVIVGIIARIKSASSGVEDDKVTWAERIANNFIKWVGIMGTVAIVMEGLPAIIEAFGKAGNVSGTDILTTMLGVVALVGGLGLVFAAIDKITGNEGISIKGAASSAVAIVAVLGIILSAFGAIFSLEGGVLSIFGTDAAHAVKMIQDGADVFAAIGKGLHDIITALLFGSETDTAKQVRAEEEIDWLSKIVDQMDDLQISRIGNLMDLISKMSEVKMDFQNLELIRDILPQLGDSLNAFYWSTENITGGEDADAKVERLIKLISVVDTFANGIGAISDAYRILAYAGNTTFTDLEGNSTLGEFMEFYSAAAEQLATAVQKGLGETGQITFNATPIVDSIVLALGYGETAISTAVHDMVQRGINLAGPKNGTDSGYNMSWLTNGDLLSSVLGGEGINLDTLLSNYNDAEFNKALYGEDGKSGLIGSMQGALGDLENMDNIGDVLATKFGGATTFTDAEGNELDALSYIQGQMGELQTSLENLPAFEIKIVPVFDMSGLTAEAIQQQLFQRTFGVGVRVPEMSVKLDDSAMVGELQAVNTRLDGLAFRMTTEEALTRVAINEMSGHIDTIAEAISQMQIVLDTGGLVGGLTSGLDFSLGARMNIGARTGVDPKWTYGKSAADMTP